MQHCYFRAAFLTTLLVLHTACGPGGRPFAVFQFVTGEVYVLPGGSEENQRRAKIGSGADAVDSVKTLAASAAELDVLGIGTVRVGEESLLRLAELDGGRTIQIRVESGKAGFVIKKMQRNSEFRVSTPTTTASVRGTKFLAGIYEGDETGGAERSKIAMFDGALELSDAAGHTLYLDGPGEVSLRANQQLDEVTVEPLSEESIAEMKALEEMTSPGGVSVPEPDMIPRSDSGVAPSGDQLKLPE